MSIVEDLHAQHKARLARMGAPPRFQRPLPRRIAPPPPEPFPHNAGWEGMWFFDLITEHKPPREVRVRDIQVAVCNHFNVSILDMLSGRRTVDISGPRMVAMYLCKEFTLNSYAEIGRRFGGRDHTTIIHGHRKIEGLYGFDLKTTADVNAIRRVLR